MTCALATLASRPTRRCLKSPGRSRLTVQESGFVPAAWRVEWRNIVGENDEIGTFQTPSELTDAERDALRTYLDEKSFKTAMIDDNLAIAGELTWQEVIVPIEGFYEGKADVYPF